MSRHHAAGAIIPSRVVRATDKEADGHGKPTRREEDVA